MYRLYIYIERILYRLYRLHILLVLKCHSWYIRILYLMNGRSIVLNGTPVTYTILAEYRPKYRFAKSILLFNSKLNFLYNWKINNFRNVILSCFHELYHILQFLLHCISWTHQCWIKFSVAWHRQWNKTTRGPLTDAKIEWNYI